MQLTRRFTNHAGELFNEFDRLFRHTVGRPSSLPRNFSLYETDQSWILRTDLPGLRKEDLSINVEDGVLDLKGASENELIATEINQSLRLPKGVRVDGIAARLEHGVLELVLPKSEPESPESIRIDVN
jgi:HSP20 family protein